jgi:hypothetical protein
MTDEGHSGPDPSGLNCEVFSEGSFLSIKQFFLLNIMHLKKRKNTCLDIDFLGITLKSTWSPRDDHPFSPEIYPFFPPKGGGPGEKGECIYPIRRAK